MTKGPILFDLDVAGAGESPATAPPVPDAGAPEGQAMTALAAGTQRGGPLGRLILGALGGLAALALGMWLADLLAALWQRAAALGLVASVLAGALGAGILALLLREAAGLARLGRIDRLRREAGAALAGGDLAGARAVAARLSRLHAPRAEARWARARLDEATENLMDADAVLTAAEAELLTPLDTAARAAIEGAARRVAAATALVPLSFADIAAALVINLGMIRRVAAIYGGRPGLLGGWRLTRAVFGHLLATGALAVGDDLIGSVAGGHLLSRVSRRFGEGVVNGALTARVGLAAIETCRPLPFIRAERPSTRALVRRALSGLFAGAGG